VLKLEINFIIVHLSQGIRVASKKRLPDEDISPSQSDTDNKGEDRQYKVDLTLHNVHL
jgi:hypothetical protein